MRCIILTENLYFVKNVLENVNSGISFSVITNEKEFRETAKEKEIGIIFLDNDLDEGFKNFVLDIYKNCTIVVRLDKDFENGILTTNISLQMNRIVNHHQKELVRSKIITELRNLGYSLKHQGTYYLTDAILEVLYSRAAISHNLRSDIYPVLAKKYGKTTHNIKSSIHKATEYMYLNCDGEKIKDYFDFDDDVRPSIKQVIFGIINKIA